MRKVLEYILSDPSILVHASLYGLHVSGLGSEDPLHLCRLYWALATCMPVYEVIGLYMRMRTIQTKISLRICAVPPVPLLFAYSKAYRPRRDKTHIRGSDNAKLKPVSPATETS